MKKATNLLAAAAVAAAIFFGSNAKAQTTTTNAGGDSQNDWRLGFGVEPSIPVGSNISDFSKFELGGEARLQYDIKGAASLMLTSGYYNFFAKGDVNQDLHIIPIKAGAKWFFTPGWYVDGEAGVGIETNEGGNTKLLLSPGVGYASNSGLDISANYQNFSGQSFSFGIVGLRIAYGFKL
jgi:hypothetical protein